MLNDILLNNLRAVNVSNVVEFGDKLFSYLFTQVNATELGTQIGELLANYRVVSKNNAITLMDMIVKNDHRIGLSLADGLQADLDYRNGIINRKDQYYKVDMEGMPIGFAPDDIDNIIRATFNIEKQVANY